MDLKKIARRIANNLEELGMSADLGQDEVMTSTHTNIDEYVNQDRPAFVDQACDHTKANPGDKICPTCGQPIYSLKNS